MPENLDTILAALHSDKSRIAFLNRVYTPGNAEVADRILSLVPRDIDVLDKETKYAAEHRETGRFLTLARRSVESYIEQDFSILLRDKVIQWGDRDIADYAIRRLAEKHEEAPLEYAVEIAQSFGRPEQANQLLEKLLAVQLERSESEKYYNPSAQTCVKLGRFDQAINLFLQGNYYSLAQALTIAKEHVPGRVKEIAQRGFGEYKPGFNKQGTYLECAERLGKTDEARERLSEEARTLIPKDSPRFYEGLVDALLKLGMRNEANLVVEKIAIVQGQLNRVEGPSLDNLQEVARLSQKLGVLAPSKDIYLARIRIGMEQGWHPSNIMRDIETGFQITGDRVFLEKKVELFELHEKYAKAAELALQLGNPGLAQTYQQMQAMVETAHTEK